jgi:acyl-CoA thioester hydrolase
MKTTKNVTGVKVYYKDTDAGGVVYYANYLGWLEMGRAGLVEQLGISQKKLKEDNNIVFAIREVNCKYLSPALLHDELEIVTSIEELGGATVKFKQEIFRAGGGAKLIEALVTAFAMDLVNLRPAKIPAEARQKLETSP